ncbi:MAG: hypothetical protein ACOCV1_03475 [Bacillota bacterium]
MLTDDILKLLLVEYSFGSEIYKNYISKNYFLSINSSIIFLAISVFLMLVLYFKLNRERLKLGLVFLLAGGISHLLDLTLNGFLLTYINIKNILYINLSFVFLVVGFIILIYGFLKIIRGEKNVTTI